MSGTVGTPLARSQSCCPARKRAHTEGRKGLPGAVVPLGSKQPIRVDVRIIAASNVPLEREMRAGRFRQDVYYRLNEFVITLPPLRERDDVLHLANGFLAEASMEFGRPCREISEAAAQLLRYPWPGNVRQLRNVIRRAILLA